MGGEGHAAVGDRDVQAGGAGEAADDGLAVGGHGADADLDVLDAGVDEAANRLLGPAEQRGRPAAQVGFGSVQVYGGVGCFQVQQAARMRAQADLGGVHQVYGTSRSERAGAHHQAGSGRPGFFPVHQR